MLAAGVGRYQIPSTGPASSAVFALLSAPQTAQSGEREGINLLIQFLIFCTRRIAVEKQLS